MFTGVFAPTKGWGQNNLTVKSYWQSTGVTGLKVDGSVLDAVFGTVTGEGIVRTSDWTCVNTLSMLPVNASDFNVQCVILGGIGTSGNGGTVISLAQANALINYVKGGGILIANMEQVTVDGNGDFTEFVGEALFCGTVPLTTTGTVSGGVSPAPAFHPGNGALLLNSGGASSTITTTTFATTIGVPSASSIIAGQSSASGVCDSIPVLDFIVPSYPKGCTTCGVNGFAILSGEIQGGLVSYGNTSRDNSQLNINYAQLIYDFLYDPAAMATRCNWSTIPTNRNTACRPYNKTPDFTPTIEIENIIFWPNAERDFLVNINEIIYGQSCGQVVVKIPKSSAFDITFSPTMTTANVYGAIAVSNSLWTKTENALFITLTLNLGVIISGHDIFQIGMHVKRKSGTPAQTNVPLTATIVGGSGNDSNSANNTYNVVIKAQ